MKRIRVGTRSSNLAITQTNIVIDGLKRKYREIEFELVGIKTKGDIDLKRPLYTMQNKGIFAKELNESVENGDIDFAVHSLKDVPYDLSDSLMISSIPKRAKPNDVLISKGKKKLLDMHTSAIIGTSSLRRAIQIKSVRKDLIVKPIRGNIETRIKKALDNELYDAVVLAEAGISRLGMDSLISERFRIDKFVPAPGQGAIAVVTRKDAHHIDRILSSIEDYKTRLEVSVELDIIRALGGGCRFPIGTTAKLTGKEILLYVDIYSADGAEHIKFKERAPAAMRDNLIESANNYLKKKKIDSFLSGWQYAIDEWSKNAER